MFCSVRTLNTLCALSSLALALAALNAGCISTEETVYRDQERVKVEFESDTAGRLFYEALSKLKGRYDKRESRTEVSIPVVFDHKRRVIDGENAALNEAVRLCDTNGDGIITDLEARIFDEEVSQRP